MANQEDLRVKKTRKALYEAFLDMLSERTFDDITINELCDRAGVRRATFYKHYADKFAFLTAFTEAMRKRFDEKHWSKEKYESTPAYYVAYAKRLVEFVSEHEAAIDNILKSDLLPTVLSLMILQNYQDTKANLDKSVSEDMKLCASTSVVASMCCGAVAAALYLWAANGRVQSADELANEIGAVVEAMVSPKK